MSGRESFGERTSAESAEDAREVRPLLSESPEQLYYTVTAALRASLADAVVLLDALDALRELELRAREAGANQKDRDVR